MNGSVITVSCNTSSNWRTDTQQAWWLVGRDYQTVRHSALCRNETSVTHDITLHGHRHAQRERQEAVSM